MITLKLNEAQYKRLIDIMDFSASFCTNDCGDDDAKTKYKFSDNEIRHILLWSGNHKNFDEWFAENVYEEEDREDMVEEFNKKPWKLLTSWDVEYYMCDIIKNNEKNKFAEL